jgi:eukaryotic-like serine/threonine-protein kinase
VEYVPGGDLKALIDRRGPLPGAMLSRIGAAVADGLAHAHERGVVHRDIKPQNVLIDEYGSPKLTDFGIARALDTAHSTSTDSYLGTATYSSPEQLQGERVTPKSDVYSLGATLYHAAVGGPPFTGDPLQVASQQLAKPPVPPRARGALVGERLEALILGCLAKDAAYRPDTFALHERLLQISAAATAPPAGAIGASGLARATGAARSAGVAGVKAFRRGLGRDTPELSGPPERTISIPTRTFRAGSRQRRALASAVVSLLLISVIAVGAWALFDPTAGGVPEPIQRISEPLRETPAPPVAQQRAENQAGGSGAAAPAQEPVQEPALPAAAAEQAVFDMYYEMSFARPDTSYAFLSERLQNEIGSVQQWAQQEDIYTFTYMEFTQYPVAEVSGDTADVTFAVRLDHTWGSELLSGTWVCVVENGEWKLDRLENESVQTL